MASLMELRLHASADAWTEAWEATNLHTVAVVPRGRGAQREETRGSHWREDFPDRDDANWRGRLVGRLSDGAARLSFEEIAGEAQP